MDAPPGTSDEHISIAQFLRAGATPAVGEPAAAAGCATGDTLTRNVGGGFDTAVIVTTPQEVSIIDVRKEISFCRKVGLAVLGVVENMAGLRLATTAPELRFVLRQPTAANEDAAAAASAGGAGEEGGDGEKDVTHVVLEALAAALPGGLEGLELRADVFTPSGGGAAAMCKKLGLKLLGRVPLDPQLGQAAEEGRSVFEQQQQRALSPSAAALQAIVRRVLAATEGGSNGVVEGGAVGMGTA